MSNNRKYTLLALGLIVIFVAAQLAYSSRVSNTKTVSGMVTSVTEGGLKDIVVSLKNIRGIHYISKSNTRGLTAEELNDSLVNKVVSLTYIQPGVFSNLSPVTSTRLITKIDLQDSTVYSSSN